MNDIDTALGDIDKAVGELLEDPKAREAYMRQAQRIHLARMIREWRTGAKLTQAELARKIRTKQSVISRLESVDNPNMPKVDTLIAIAHACGQYLFLGAGTGEPAELDAILDEAGVEHDHLVAF